MSHIDQVLAKSWFYEFDLPDGRKTVSYLPEHVRPIHLTRKIMLDSVIDKVFENRWLSIDALDLACHQGFYSAHLAQKGTGKVVSLDARDEHVTDTRLITETLGLDQVHASQIDVHEVTPEAFGQFDLVLMFGLLYHLENPIGALRVAHAMTKELCVIETQVAPNLAGPLDWGSYEFVQPMRGSFALVDETEATDGPEMSTTGICMAPSVEGLLWCLKKVGFEKVEVVPPPKDAYEQHRFGKRVVVACYV